MSDDKKDVLAAGSVVTVNGVDYTLCADVDVDPAVPPVVYPRLMWAPSGEEVTVKDADEEAAKLAEGYRLTAESEPAPATEPVDEESDGPTFGGPQDDTFGEGDAAPTKKASKKK